MPNLKISHIQKSKEEYMEEGLEYFTSLCASNNQTAMDFLKFSLENPDTENAIKECYKNRYESIDNSKEERITNVDNVDYSEDFVRSILFYVMNTTGEEQEIYYQRLMFLETWKMDFFNMLISDNEVNDFAVSKIYRQWKIKKVLA